MKTKIEIYDFGESVPIITQTDYTHNESKIEAEEIDINNDGIISFEDGEIFKSIIIKGSILLGNIGEVVNDTEAKVQKEAKEVKNLINWTLLRNEDKKSRKKIVMTTTLGSETNSSDIFNVSTT